MLTDPILEHLQKNYGLDEFQAPAANHLDGPALVLACAGSGKTTTLTARVIHLISHHKVPASQILCITFTNKATNHMKAKITKHLGQETILPHISTIHSLGLKVIREHPRYAFDALADLAHMPKIVSAEYPRLTTWSERNCETAFKKICEENEYEGHVGNALDRVLYLSNRGYTADSYEQALKDHPEIVDQERMALKTHEIVLWKTYVKHKYAFRALDFADMMLLANKILETHPKVRAKYHERWTHILQDEAQDASPLQWRLLDLLTNPATNNLFCVGDASQSIMSFNGASPTIIQDFQKSYNGVTPAFYPLLNNYRSHKTIVAVANTIEQSLIGNHPSPMVDKAGISAGGALQYSEYMDSEEEADSIARTIIGLAPVPQFERLNAFLATPRLPLGQNQRYARPAPVVKPKPFKLKDIAILVRMKSLIPVIENALLQYQIPYFVKNGKSLLQTKEVLDLLSYFRVIVNPYDVISFERAVQVPKRGFGEESVKKLVAKSLESGEPIINLSEQTKLAGTKFGSLLSGLQTRIESKPSEITDHITWWSGSIDYSKEIKKASRDADDEERRNENVKRFTLMAQSIMDSGAVSSLSEFLDYVTLMQDAGSATIEDDRVQLMTAHSSKGLEYEVVFAPSFCEGIIPHHKSLKYTDELAEEARLTYVIFTRAIRQLRVSRPLTQITRNTRGQTTRSRFFEPVRKLFSDPSNILPG